MLLGTMCSAQTQSRKSCSIKAEWKLMIIFFRTNAFIHWKYLEIMITVGWGVAGSSAGIMAQLAKFQPLSTGIPYEPVHITAALVPIQLSAVVCEGSGQRLKALGMCIWWKIGGGSGSWPPIGSALAIAAVWGIDGESFSLSYLLSIDLPLQ